jgi:ribose transport system ATP-binding protein
MGNILLTMRGIDKSFASVKVLDKVDFNVYCSEVMALLGENGAGKSTLMKILSGIYKKDGGEIIYNNEVVDFNSPHDAYNKGIYIIMQEVNLISEFTVAEAIYLGIEPVKQMGKIHWKKINENVSRVLMDLKLPFSGSVKVKNLSVGNQKMVELARAIIFNANLIIMDEPTDALTHMEKDILFNVIKNLKGNGKSIIYITHRLDEVFEICDRVTVLRDGKAVYEDKAANVNKNILISKMAGQVEIKDVYWEETKRDTEILKVNKVKNQFIKDVSFLVHGSEIFGIYGLVGSGRTALAKTIYGIYKCDSGEITLRGSPLKLRSCISAKERGIIYISEDRKSEGLILNLTIRENTTLSSLRKYSQHFGIINSEREKYAVNEYVKKLKIKANSIEDKVLYLSGGNQQKVCFAKGLDCDPTVLRLDEPTRGVEVVDRREIYRIIKFL